MVNSKFQAAAKGASTSGPIKTPVKLSDEISIIPTKKGGEKKVKIILFLTLLNISRSMERNGSKVLILYVLFLVIFRAR